MFWDNVAGLYDLFQKLGNGKVNRQLPGLVAAQLRAEDRVLECACGTGMLTREAAAACRSLVATDISEPMLRKARKKCRDLTNVEFRTADLIHLPFSESTFDALIAANVLHLLLDPSAALKEFRRAAKPGGRLILPTYLIQAQDGSMLPKAKLLQRMGAGFQRAFSADGYAAFLRENGFEPHMQVVDGDIPCGIAVVST